MAREYKDSGIEWIGQIPKEWEVNKGKQLYISNDGGVWGEDATGTNDTLVLRSTEQDIDGRLSINEPAMRHLSEIERQNAMLKEGDLIITKSSGSPSHIGKTSVISKDVASMDCCFSNFIQRIRIDGIPQYYWYVFNSFVVKDQFSYLSTTTTGINNINAKTLDQLQLLSPTTFEQQKIADYLDKVCGEVDEMIALQEQMIEELKAYKQSVITEAVTKGLNPNVPMRDSGIDWIGEIPEHWEIARVGLFYFVTKLAGFEYTDTLMNKISSSEVVPIVRAQNVRMFRFENESISEFIDLETSLLLDRCSLNKKSLLMTFIGAGIGDVCIFDEPQRYHLAPNVAKIEKNSDNDDIICDEYIMFYFGSDAGKGDINKISKASAQASLSMSTIRKISITIPPISEQRSIASYLDTKCSEIDSLIAIKQAKIEELKEYKKSVIYEYVTGKKEVV